jgi:hypothetical protein
MKITLCGSTRFGQAFRDWDVILTKAGHTVYTICRMEGDASEEEKRRFDLVHQDKINHSDAIVVLNVDGYYGESTTREIEWARMHGKTVYWLENRPAVSGRVLGPSVWTIYDLFDGGAITAQAFLDATPEANKYVAAA